MKKPFSPATFWTTGAAKRLATVDDIEACPEGEGNCCLYYGYHLSEHVDGAEFPISGITAEDLDRMETLAGALERYAASIRRLLERQASSIK